MVRKKDNPFIPKYKNREYSQGKINLKIARINHTCFYDCFVFNVKPDLPTYGKNRIDQRVGKPLGLASPAVKAGLRGFMRTNAKQCSGKGQAKKLDKGMTYAYFHPAKVEKVTGLSRRVVP